jgi:hypothetical protein
VAGRERHEHGLSGGFRDGGADRLSARRVALIALGAVLGAVILGTATFLFLRLGVPRSEPSVAVSTVTGPGFVFTLPPGWKETPTPTDLQNGVKQVEKPPVAAVVVQRADNLALGPLPTVDDLTREGAAYTQGLDGKFEGAEAIVVGGEPATLERYSQNLHSGPQECAQAFAVHRDADYIITYCADAAPGGATPSPGTREAITSRDFAEMLDSWRWTS